MHRAFATAAALTLLVGLSPAGLTSLPAASFEPPGFRPRPLGLHALTGARLVPRPGLELTNATLIVSNGLIAAVLTDVAPPPAARVWNLSGHTIYAGFLEPYLPAPSPKANAAAAPSSPSPASASSPDPARAFSPENTLGPRFYGVAGQESDPGAPGAGSGSSLVTPEHRMATSYVPDPGTCAALRQLGFTAAHVVPDRGYFRGQSAVVTLGDAGPNAAVVRADVALCVGFDANGARRGGDHALPEGYPGSLMGVLALIRQTFFDAGYYAEDQADYERASSPGAETTKPRPRPAFHAALEALQAARRGQPVFFEPGSVLMVDRAAHVATELGLLSRVFVASGQEWRRPDLMEAARGPFIVPLAFPALPKFVDEADWEGVALDQLRAWDWAAENPALLHARGATLALSTFGLEDRPQFRPNLQAALDRGLSESNALASLTILPAQLCGVADRLGTLDVGKIANLTIVAGSYFDPEAPVAAVWIDGSPYESPPAKPSTRPGDSPDTQASKRSADSRAAEFRQLARTRVAKSPLENRGALAHPPAVLIRDATLWTLGPEGVRTNASLLVSEGRIQLVGDFQAKLTADALVIDGTGLHVTPGLIDCHSHSMILGAVNEMTLPSSAMVRIGDVVNSETDNLHEQLAGGLTVANLLHGSANPIGGQNCVIKLRDGAGPDDLKFAAAPLGIKFALGENVKQSNWGERFNSRFPQTRMGVPTFYVNRFTAAQEYLAARRRHAESPSATPPVRRDLELEALGEILEGQRLIHCHSYRQDEILAFLRTMESFGVRVATLQHVLEGYKVADEIARHGAGGSAFADWWAYKYEVIDAIPYAGSLMRDRGVVVSFNSDSDDHARRLNLEAAKAIKYGGTPPVEALAFVTLNPARQLRIDRWVGSLEPGKDADFVVWSGNPLDSRSICLQTWIEGRKYFDRSLEPARARALDAERTALLDKARQISRGAGDTPSAASQKARERFFQRALERARQLGVSQCLDCQILPRHQRQ